MNTKRKHNEEDDTAKKIKTSDIEVLKEMQTKLNQSDLKINEEIEITKQKYFVSYVKNVLKELPICSKIIDLESIKETRDGFLKAYSIVKTCVNSHFQIKQIKTLNSLFDAIHNVAGKFLHDKYISPYLKKFLPESSLQNAFAKYQETLVSEDNDKITELHCYAYLIQKEIEKNEPLKIPNPLYNRFNQQLTAACNYVKELIKAIATTPLKDKNVTTE